MYAVTVKPMCSWINTVLSGSAILRAVVCLPENITKGCRKKCTQQSRKVLWVVLGSRFFKEICKNGTRDHRLMFVIAKGKQQK